jgi:hypothetical protein
MNHYTKGYSKKLGDTLRENEALKSRVRSLEENYCSLVAHNNESLLACHHAEAVLEEKVAALEAACTYDVMSVACNAFEQISTYGYSRRRKELWAKCVLEALEETNSPGGE